MCINYDHVAYSNKTASITDDFYLTTQRESSYHFGSFFINELEICYDKAGFICDMVGYIGCPLKNNINAYIENEKYGNIQVEKAVKLAKIELQSVKNQDIRNCRYDNLLVIGGIGNKLLRVFSNAGILFSDREVVGAYVLLLAGVPSV